MPTMADIFNDPIDIQNSKIIWPIVERTTKSPNPTVVIVMKISQIEF